MFRQWTKKNSTLYLIHKGVNRFKIISVSFTFTVVCIAWIFFRANSITQAFYFIGEIFTNLQLKNIFNLESYTFALSKIEFVNLFLFIVLLLIFEMIHRHKNIRYWINNKNIVFRWLIYFIIIITIAIFGVYGDHEVSEFIYFQF